MNNAMHYMGIDGGGSTLRIAVVNEAMQCLHRIESSTANPNIIGRDAAAERIQQGIREILQHVGTVEAAGVGIAGASAEYAANWLRQVITPVLPDVSLALASDNEIALVGALGRTRGGVLILAGTGSVAFGMNDRGEKCQVGGWGYLLGDEGSGFWIGKCALQQITRDYDTGQSQHFLTRLNLPLQTRRQIIEFAYQTDNNVQHIASLAPLVIEAADTGSSVAQSILEEATGHLLRQARLVAKRLEIAQPDYAFAGGLLERDNLLSRSLADNLGLAARPVAIYPPVIGAALLAKIRCEQDTYP
jgi:N-acetylglucosamine kinase-like BadF-type ATPase